MKMPGSQSIDYRVFLYEEAAPGLLSYLAVNFKLPLLLIEFHGVVCVAIKAACFWSSEVLLENFNEDASASCIEKRERFYISLHTGGQFGIKISVFRPRYGLRRGRRQLSYTVTPFRTIEPESCRMMGNDCNRIAIIAFYRANNSATTGFNYPGVFTIATDKNVPRLRVEHFIPAKFEDSISES